MLGVGWGRRRGKRAASVGVGGVKEGSVAGWGTCTCIPTGVYESYDMISNLHLDSDPLWGGFEGLSDYLAWIGWIIGSLAMSFGFGFFTFAFPFWNLLVMSMRHFYHFLFYFYSSSLRSSLFCIVVDINIVVVVWLFVGERSVESQLPLHSSELQWGMD